MIRLPRLWLRIAWPVLLFVVAGSVALAAWMHSVSQRRSHAVFAALAQKNAEFIRDRRLAFSEEMAGYVSRMLNVQAIIRREPFELLPAPDAGLIAHRDALLSLRAEHAVVRLGDRLEAIAAIVDARHTLLLVRSAEPALSFLFERETMLVLGAFWLLSIALAWSITRGVVRPLRLLAARLPHIAEDAEPSLPGAEREDEIGQVARAYLETRGQLAAERERRIAAERFALLGRMATGLAHEIHNPLSAIRLHAQMLSTAPPEELAAASAESAVVLLSESARIESLVNQWMFLARPAPPQVSPLNLRDLVTEVLRAHAALAAHAEVKIETKIPAGLTAEADRRRMAQAVSNVVINAIQAMPGGGRLELEGHGETGGATLLFRDTGPGFSPTALSRFAELFYSEREGGMGIGLSVSSEILSAHGGTLSVANASAGGALVTLALPRHSPPNLRRSTSP